MHTQKSQLYDCVRPNERELFCFHFLPNFLFWLHFLSWDDVKMLVIDLIVRSLGSFTHVLSLADVNVPIIFNMRFFLFVSCDLSRIVFNLCSLVVCLFSSFDRVPWQLFIALRESELAWRVLTEDPATKVNSRNVQKWCPYESFVWCDEWDEKVSLTVWSGVFARSLITYDSFPDKIFSATLFLSPMESKFQLIRWCWLHAVPTSTPCLPALRSRDRIELPYKRSTVKQCNCSSNMFTLQWWSSPRKMCKFYWQQRICYSWMMFATLVVIIYNRN